MDRKSVYFACAAMDNIPVDMSCTVVATGTKYGTGVELCVNCLCDPTAVPLCDTFNPTSFPRAEISQIAQTTYTIENTPANVANFLLLYRDNDVHTAYFTLMC